MGIVGNKFASNKNLLDLWSFYINSFFYRDDVMVFKKKIWHLRTVEVYIFYFK